MSADWSICPRQMNHYKLGTSKVRTAKLLLVSCTGTLWLKSEIATDVTWRPVSPLLLGSGWLSRRQQCSSVERQRPGDINSTWRAAASAAVVSRGRRITHRVLCDSGWFVAVKIHRVETFTFPGNSGWEDTFTFTSPRLCRLRLGEIF